MLNAKDSMVLITRLHEVSGESDTTQKLASAIGRIAVARAEGKGLGKALDAELLRISEELGVK